MTSFYRKLRTTKRMLAVAVLIVIVVIFLVAHWLHFRMTHIITDDARVDGDVITLSSRVAGWITQFPVIEGDATSKGQTIATIDDRETRHKRAVLEAQLESNLQQSKSLEAEIRQTEASTQGALENTRGKLESTIASRESARLHLEQVRMDYRRSEDLAAKKFISPQALDTARTSLAQAEADLQKAGAEIAASRGAQLTAQADRDKIDMLRAKLKASAADAEQIRAQIATLDTEILDRTIKSPVDGAVVMTFVRANEYVVAGQRLAMIYDPRQQWIEANVKETDIANVEVGQPVAINVSAYPDRVFEGKVARVGGAATSKFALLPDPNPSGNFTKITQRLPVRITLNQFAPELRPGMMVEVAIDHRSR